MLRITQKGDLKKTKNFLKVVKARKYFGNILEYYGRRGVEALSSATPVRTGKTASSWNYEVVRTKESTTIYWVNSNVEKYVNIAIILQYGHATGTGGYVQGRDYINPAIQPIFDEIANGVWKEVTSQ